MQSMGATNRLQWAHEPIATNYCFTLNERNPLFWQIPTHSVEPVYAKVRFSSANRLAIKYISNMPTVREIECVYGGMFS